MAYMRVHTLVVLTLLQLCPAEIPESLPESWYSANVINEGFHPKPISEIFTTYPPFSSAKPIVVLSTASVVPDEIALLSTLPPPRTSNVFPSSEGYTLLPKSTPSLPAVQNTPPQIIQFSPSPQVQTIPPQTLPALLPRPEIQVQSESPQPFLTESTPPPEFSMQPQFLTQPQSPVFQTLGPTSLSTQQPNIQQPTILPQNPIRIELSPQAQISQRPSDFPNAPAQVVQAAGVGNLPNNILIYQQAPQYVQREASTLLPSQVTRATTPIPILPSSTAIPTVFTEPTVSIQPRPIVSTPSSLNAPPISTTVRASRVTVTPSRSSNPVPCNTSLLQATSGTFPALKIRVVAPSGSITNVRINPITSTTRAPTTTRSRKPKRNTYDRCLDGCKSNRNPICAVPLSSKVIDPDTLKGFPSVCHMACHNSYRRDAYEQLMEGRCGRLRTRIRTVGSNTKLKRDELNKAQYFVDNTRPPTVVEFSGALH